MARLFVSEGHNLTFATGAIDRDIVRTLGLFLWEVKCECWCCDRYCYHLHLFVEKLMPFKRKTRFLNKCYLLNVGVVSTM